MSELVVVALVSVSMAFLLAGIKRKLRARIQGRVGPPVLQPLYDFVKLLLKSSSMPETATTLYTLAPILCLAFSLAACLVLPVAGLAPLSFAGDMIVFFLLLTASSANLVAGGLASSNPYSGLGSSRGLLLLTAIELPLALVIASLYAATGELGLAEIATKLENNRVLYAPLAPSLLALLVYAMGKTWTTPFSAPKAETEIMDGPTIEYGGTLLAMFELSHFLELYALSGLLSNLLLPLVATPYVYINITLYLVLLVLVVAALAVLESVFARLRPDQAFKALISVPTLLALSSLLLAGVIR